MNTYINIIFTLFLLLPGFISLKIRQSTREYKELSNFEFTSISLGFSFLIFLIWLSLNFIVMTISEKYSFFNDLKSIITQQKLDVLFSTFFLLFIISYFFAFTLFSLIIYNFHWIGIWNKILRKFGLTRFSSHLTPWEDFQILSKLDWVIVELKDGKTIVGKLGFGSHLPFDKEIVLKRTDLSPIQMYDEKKKPLELGPEIELTYIHYSDINTIHSVKDKSIETSQQSIKDYITQMASLVLSCLFIITLFIFMALKTNGLHSCNFLIYIALFACSCISIGWNFKSLSTFS